MKCHAVWGIWLNCTWVAICWNIFPPDRSPDWADWRSFSYYPITCAILIRKPSTDYPISSGWLSTTIFSPFYLPASSTNAPNSKECNPFPSMNSIIILSCQFIIGWVNSMDSLISFLFFSVLFFPFFFFFFNRQLDSNQFMFLHEGTLDSMPNLQYVNLIKNPWHCDCTILYLTK